MPVVPAASQSMLLPHAQADGFAAEPSVMAHAAGREQVLDAAVQTMPVPCPSPLLVQSSLPQAQADGLAAEPSVVAQVGIARHLFWDRWQCIPVVPAVSQSTVPQAQADGLGAEPSVIAQVENCLHLFWDR